MKAILDPIARQASVVPDAALEGHDLADMTVLDLPGDFSWVGKTVDWDTLAIVADIEGARAAKWEAVKALRATVQQGGCQTPFGPAQTDLESRGLINGAVTLAMLSLQAGQPFALEFTLADNSSLMLDASSMIGLGQAVGLFVAAAHAYSVTLRALIDSAPTIAALDAIEISVGWPEGWQA